MSNDTVHLVALGSRVGAPSQAYRELGGRIPGEESANEQLSLIVSD